jgi:hypothetical protein
MANCIQSFSGNTVPKRQDLFIGILLSIFQTALQFFLSGPVLSAAHKSFIYRHVAQHAIWPGLAGSRYVTPFSWKRKLMVPDRLWYCTVQTVLLGAVCSHVPARPTFRQSFTDKWGVVGWGKQKMFMFDWSAFL